MACPAPQDITAHGTNGKNLQERGKKVRPVRQHVLESVRCMRANERRVQHVQVHNRSCVHAARISKRAMHGGMKRKLHACERSLHATCLAELHDQLPVRTQHTHNDQRGVLRERRAPRNDLGATTFALARVRWTDFSGAPASRSDTRRRSSTLPEVRCSDVSGPPASRSYTRWPQLHLARSPLERGRCVEGGSQVEAAAKREKFWTEASICTSSLWIEFACEFCTMTLVHF